MPRADGTGARRGGDDDDGRAEMRRRRRGRRRSRRAGNEEARRGRRLSMRERETELGSASLGGDDAGPLINLGCFFFLESSTWAPPIFCLTWASIGPQTFAFGTTISRSFSLQPKHGVPILFLIGNGRL